MSPDVDSEAAAWAFDPAAEAWAEHGVSTWEEAKPWIDAGWPPSDISGWLDDKFTPAEAKRWADAGLTSQWQHINPRFQARSWHLHGFSPDEAAVWNQTAYASHAYLAAAWRDAGFAQPDAVEWSGETVRNAAGETVRFEDAAQAARWRAAGYGPAEAVTYLAVGVTEPPDRRWLPGTDQSR